MILRILADYWDWVPDRPVRDVGWTKIVCPSPEHEDTTASATVSVEHDYVKCFACGLRARPIDIVMIEEDCTPDDALDILEKYDADGSSPILQRPATREPGRRVFGGGEGVVARRRPSVRRRVFRRG